MNKLSGQWEMLCQSKASNNINEEICKAHINKIGYKDTDYFMAEAEDSYMVELNIDSDSFAEKFYMYTNRFGIADQKHDVYDVGKVVTPYSIQACQGNRFYFTIQTDNYLTDADYTFRLRYTPDYTCSSPERRQSKPLGPAVTLEPRPIISPNGEKKRINKSINNDVNLEAAVANNHDQMVQLSNKKVEFHDGDNSYAGQDVLNSQDMENFKGDDEKGLDSESNNAESSIINIRFQATLLSFLLISILYFF